MIRGVIFDMDGLLLDTEPLYEAANQEICSKYGKIYSNEVRVQVIGKAELLGAQVIVEQLQIPLHPRNFLEDREKLLIETFPKATPMPGGQRHKVPIAVATSSNSNAVKLKISGHTEWFKQFDGKIISGDNPAIKKGKPAPDIFLAASAMIGVEPSQCLVFEDSAAGVLAAKSAGMTAVAVPDPIMHQHNPDGYKIADLILPSLEHFVPQLFGLPPLD